MTAATSITVRVPLTIRHRPGRKTVVTPMTGGVVPVTTRADPELVKVLARAFRYQRMLDDGARGTRRTPMAGKKKTKTPQRNEGLGPSKWRLQHGGFGDTIRSADP